MAEEVQVRHGMRVQLDALRPDAGTGTAGRRQVRTIRVVECRQSVAQEQRRVVRPVARLAVGRPGDRRGRDDHVPDHLRVRRRVHRLGRHQRQVVESKRPTQPTQVRSLKFRHFE